MTISKELVHQILAASPVFLGDFIAGLGYGWVAPTLRLHQEGLGDSDLSLNPTQSSWIASLHDFGRLIGTLLVIFVLRFLGRKGVIVASSFVFLISWILIAFTRSVWVIEATRVIFGLAVGTFDVTCAIYLCENFKPTYRCVFGSITVACFFGGFLVEFCLVNYLTYAAVAYTNCGVAFLALASNLFAAESAEHLIPRRRQEEAFKNFLWLRGKAETTAEMVREFEVLQHHIESENRRKRSMGDFLSVPVYRKGIVMVLVLALLTAATGAPPLSSFVSIAFTEGTLTANEYTMLFGVFQLASIVFGSTIIEKVNRRTVLIVSLLVATITHSCSATLFYLQSHFVHIPHFSWWSFATITLYSMMYASGVLPVFCAARGELLPQYVRPFGGAIAITAHSLVGFLTTKVFLLVAETFGMHWNFAFYSGMSLVCALFVYIVLPETRGKSLIEIQNALEMKMNAQ